MFLFYLLSLIRQITLECLPSTKGSTERLLPSLQHEEPPLLKTSQISLLLLAGDTQDCSSPLLLSTSTLGISYERSPNFQNSLSTHNMWYFSVGSLGDSRKLQEMIKTHTWQVPCDSPERNPINTPNWYLKKLQKQFSEGTAFLANTAGHP